MSVYEAALKDGSFLIQHCGACESHIFYPRVACPNCAASDLSWRQPKGTGTVYSTTVVRRSADKGGPYNVALVDLDEGVRLMSRVDGVAPDAVRIGMRVKLQVSVLSGKPAPVFHPAEDVPV